jgi:hypothetical protein
MSKAATNKAKTRWNAEHYTQIKVYIDPGVASDFKRKCQSEDVSNHNNARNAIPLLLSFCSYLAASMKIVRARLLILNNIAVRPLANCGI